MNNVVLNDVEGLVSYTNEEYEEMVEQQSADDCKKFLELVDNGAPFEEVKKFIINVSFRYDASLAYAMLQRIIHDCYAYGYDSEYESILDLFLFIYTHGKVYGEDVVDDLEVLVSYSPTLENDKTEMTIYRGVCNDSLPLEEAISWTTSYDKAKWFATRRTGMFGDTFGEKFAGEKVYTAKIKRCNMIAYTDDRNEQEVVVLPCDVEIVNVEDVKLEE